MANTLQAHCATTEGSTMAGDKTPKRRGRPRKSDSEKFLTPARQLGRVTDEDWGLLQKAAEESGKTFTQWALEILVRNARRQTKR